MSGDHMDHGGEQLDTAGATDGRRSFLKKAGIGVAAAWTAPTLLSTTAHAQGSQNPNIGFVGAGTEGAGDGALSVVAGMPAGVQEGNLLVAAITTNGTSSMTAPSGWTEIQTNTVSYGLFGLTQARLRVWTRTATASEPSSVTFTRNSTGTAAQMRAVIVAYRDVASVSPSTNTTSGNGTSKTFPAVTTSLPNSVVLRVGMHADGNATWNAVPPGYNQRHESPSGDRGLIIFDSLQPNAGSSGTVAVTLNTSQHGVMVSAVLNPLP